jgi:hypothetical protein
MQKSAGLVALLLTLSACGDTPSTPSIPVDASADVGADAPVTLDAGDAANDAVANPDGGGDASDAGDGGDPLLPPNWFVSPTGSDTNDGKSLATPFKTFCKVQSVVQSGEVVGVMDGSFDYANQRPIGWSLNPPCEPNFAQPIVLQAVNAGKATVKVTLTLAQGGTIRGLALDFDRSGSTVLSAGAIHASAGSLLIRGLSLGDVSSQPNAKIAVLVASGTAKVTLRPDQVTNYTTVPVPAGRGLSLASVTGSAELTVEGGTLDDSAASNADGFCNPLFEVASGKLVVHGMTIRHKGGVLRGASATVTFDQTSVLEDRSTAANVGCTPILGYFGTTTIDVASSTLRGGRAAIENEPTSTTGTLSVTGSAIENAIDYGVNLNTQSSLTFKLRGTKITGSNVGVRVSPTATANLGTNGDPGNNTFTGNTTTSLRVESTTVVDAAGNTWTPNQQGADGQGKYGATLKVGPESGVNLVLPSAAQSVQM